mgnify:CR=1 FL=1
MNTTPAYAAIAEREHNPYAPLLEDDLDPAVTAPPTCTEPGQRCDLSHEMEVETGRYVVVCWNHDHLTDPR